MRILLLLLASSIVAACAARKRGFSPETAHSEGVVTPFVTIAAGPDGTCAIRQDSTLWCWGHNARQGLGLGDDTRILRPLQVGPLNEVTAVAPGSDHTCALRSDQTLYCIGRNAKGQLGNGLGQDSNLFVAVEGRWRSVAVGDGSTCGVKADGSLWCWGAPDSTAKRAQSLVPVRVGDASDWVGVDSTAAGRKADGSAATFGSLLKPKTDLHCTVRSDASLWCWGQDLIVGAPSFQVYSEESPYQMSPDSDWSAVTVGSEHACALTKNGRAYCWGANSFGQLGLDRGPDEVTFERWPSPVRMP